VEVSAVAALLNLPWTLLGILAAAISWPRSVQVDHKPFSVVFSVRSFWWKTWLKSQRGVRAATCGQVILLSPRADDMDLAHELIHVDQYLHEPLIHPLLYLYESYKHGYQQNRYEIEAYTKSGSRYEG
jgi:hypothetical protein